jgi:signal transduction histidine kinase
MNIITNAVQAIHKKGEIKIKTQHDDKEIYVEISDDGPGIPKENLEKIFQPFFSSKEYGKGTGLGL